MPNWFIISFSLLYLAFALFWDQVYRVAFAHRIFKRTWPCVRWLGLDHSWKMFAHNDSRVVLIHELWLCRGTERTRAKMPRLFEFKRWEGGMMISTNHFL